ncbi:MAG TPA: hypothetical protein VGJ84_03575 [Polyangiaceae bacterium]|jgi:hypothetical protein
MRPLRAQLVALFTVAAVFLAQGAFARTSYFCFMMGRTVPSCCCKAEPRSSGPSAESRILARDCCERIGSAQGARMSSTLEKSVNVPAGSLVATLPIATYVAPHAHRMTALPAQARAPPAVGPPLFIAHCAYLI